MVEMRPATREDIERHNAEALTRTVRAYAIEDGGELLAIMGYYPENARMILFSRILEGAHQRVRFAGRHVLKFAKALVSEAVAFGMPIYAVADPEIPRSAALLERLGFERGYKDTFIWHGFR